MSEQIPGPIGPYQPTVLLAAGAQSTVWRAEGPQGVVALKVPRTAEQRRSVAREAHLLARVSHPNVVKLVDADPEHGWLALEYIRGAPLDQWAEIQSIDAVLDALEGLVGAVAHLHERGIVHGDLKPTNVLVSPGGAVKLLDLGIASQADAPSDGFRGTLGYAAPEQLQGEAASARTDLYGLGALMYTCIAGRTPFVAPDPAALTYLPLVSLPPPPAAFRPEVPALLNQLVLALLSRSPRRRPSPVQKILAVLHKARSGLPSTPILGMHEEREEIRRAVVGAADGEPRVVVVYGPPGSGRRTLIGEAVEYARREGISYLRGRDARAALAGLKQGTPQVMVMRGTHKGSIALAKRMLDDALPGLLLLHADRPLPQLVSSSAIQLTPSPLRDADVERLAIHLDVDPGRAADWRRTSMGLPAAVLGCIRAERRIRHGATLDPDVLPDDAQRVLAALKQHTAPVKVVALARALRMPEHTLLDHCEVLLAEQLVVAAEDGLALALAP
ncbi:MAG: putative Ser/Thr protein kinase [Myxococcota bacterium]|jgi:predicted Ser/Thr protein kinase